MSIDKLKKVSSYSDVAGTDEYAETQRLSEEKTDYQRAFNALNGTTYLNKLKPIYNRARIFKAFYHILSPVLGIATAYLLAEQFLGLSITSPMFVLGIALTIGLVLVFVLFWLEDFKKHFLTEIYKSISNEKAPEKNQVLYLRLIVFFSIVISAVGGAAISYKITDNTQVISKDFKTEKDSVSRYYVTEIGTLRNQIKTIEEIRKSPARLPWGGGLTPDENQSLQVYQKRLARLEKERDTQISGLKSEHKASLTSNMANVWASVGVASGIVILFELLLVYCYRFEYLDYYKKIRHEALTYGIVPNLNVNVNAIHSQSFNLNQNLATAGVNAHNKNYATQDYIKEFADRIEKKINDIRNEMPKSRVVDEEGAKDVNANLNNVQIGFTHVNKDVNVGVNTVNKGVNIDLNSKIIFEAFNDLPAKQQKVVPHLKDYYAKLNTKDSITLEIVAEKSGVSLSTVHNVKRIVEQNMSVKTTVVDTK